jgi:hypothetical protein
MFIILENYYSESHVTGLYDNQELAFKVLRRLNGKPETRDASHNYSLVHMEVNSRCNCGNLPEIFYCSHSRRFFSYFSETGEAFQFKKYDEYVNRCKFTKGILVYTKKPPITQELPSEASGENP